MQRKGPDQTIEQLRLDQDQGFGVLARKCARWADDNHEELRRGDPKMPAGLNDRAANNWRCLLAIADLIGGDWPELARQAAAALSKDDEDDAIGVELLANLKEVLVMPKMSTEDLLNALNAMQERPWATFNKGKPMTAHQLARLLKPFGIKSKNIRDGARIVRGLERSQFEDAWTRYLPQTGGSDPLHRYNPGNPPVSDDFNPLHTPPDVADKNPSKPAAKANCSGVADRKPPDAENGATRQRIGSCAYCKDAAYDNNAGDLDRTAGTVIHYHCVPLQQSTPPSTPNPTGT
jgi:putative DNA primase/helicase